jgi:hypothetical protein
MLFIIAAENDLAALALATRWADHGAVVVSPAALSTSGWSIDPEAPEKAMAVIDGRQMRANSVRGVLTRIPAVTEGDLGHIVAGDRAYVASEMTAFLTCWLETLPCPVLNRPTASCLNGPGWVGLRWLHAGAHLGMRVKPTTVLDIPPAQSLGRWVTVVNGHCVGDVHPSLMEHAARLARAGGVELLGVQFSAPDPDAKLLNASVWPDLEEPDAADLVLARLLESER